MSLFNRIKQKVFSEFIDIIEWTDDSVDTMIWRFPRYHAEIKSGAQLTVRETQVAVLVNEGRFADVYQSGCHELTTSNMPILTALKGWKYGFNSPFKVDVYFVNTKQFLNLRWGTSSPIMMHDPEFGPIRMRAFGSFCFRVEHDPVKFIRNVAGTDGDFTSDSVNEQLRNFVIAKFTDYLAKSKIAALDLAANLNAFSSELTIALKDDFSEYGIGLTRFMVENISLPEVVEEALDKRTSMGVIGNQTTYTQMLNSQNGQPAAGQSGMGQLHNSIGFNPQKGAASPASPQVKYYMAVNGEKLGPFPVMQLQEMAQQGKFTHDTLVWTAGMPAWVVASLIPSLSQLFGEVPPPL